MTGTTTASAPAKNIGAPELIPAKCSMPIPKGIPARNVSENFIWCYLSRAGGSLSGWSISAAEPLNLDRFNVNAVVTSRFRAYLDSIDRSNRPELQVKFPVTLPGSRERECHKR